MLQEKGNLLCQIQTSRWEKSGCTGGRLHITLHVLESQSTCLCQCLQQGRNPWHGHTARGSAGALCPPRVFLCYFCVKKSPWFRKQRLLWSTLGLRGYPESHKPSQHYKASLVNVCVLSACRISFYLKRNQILFPSLTYTTLDATPGALFGSSGLL